MLKIEETIKHWSYTLVRQYTLSLGVQIRGRDWRFIIATALI